MLASYVTIVRRAAVPTAVGAAVIVALCAALVGTKGLVGALLGVAVVAVFFGISIAVVARAARVSQPAMMVAALGTFLVKIVALGVVVSSLNGTTAFSTRALGLTAIGCILLWTGSQVVAAMRVKMLYVEPQGKQ
jgi:ATP synthase protein I